MRFGHSVAFAAAALSGAALNTGAGAQAVPDTRLAQPEVEYPEPFTMVRSVAESGRDEAIVVARDPFGPTLINFRSGGERLLGRKGQGPGEWAQVDAAMHVVADTTYLLDGPRYALLAVVPPGQPRSLGFIPGAVEQADDRGHVYYIGVTGVNAASSVGGSSGAEVAAALGNRRDSMPVVRYDLRSRRPDTLAYRRGREGTAVVEFRGAGGGMASSAWGPGQPWVPLAPIDIVAFGHDGRVAIVRQPEYRVDWILADGRRVAGPAIPVTPLRLNTASTHFYSCRRFGGACSEAGVPTTWPTVARSARIAPDGNVWVEHERNVDDSLPVFDVIDTRGVLVGRVRLPDHTRLVGFGNGTAYVVRVDSDDLEYVQRYRLP